MPQIRLPNIPLTMISVSCVDKIPRMIDDSTDGCWKNWRWFFETFPSMVSPPFPLLRWLHATPGKIFFGHWSLHFRPKARLCRSLRCGLVSEQSKKTGVQATVSLALVHTFPITCFASWKLYFRLRKRKWVNFCLDLVAFLVRPSLHLRGRFIFGPSRISTTGWLADWAARAGVLRQKIPKAINRAGSYSEVEIFSLPRVRVRFFVNISSQRKLCDLCQWQRTTVRRIEPTSEWMERCFKAWFHCRCNKIRRNTALVFKMAKKPEKLFARNANIYSVWNQLVKQFGGAKLWAKKMHDFDEMHFQVFQGWKRLLFYFLISYK